MARPTSAHPTGLELEILKILWEQAPLPVRDIRRALADQGRELAHSSVITVLNIMVKKKYLKRTPRANAFLFEPSVTRGDVSQRMLGDILDRVFDGSASALMLRLIETSDINARELAEVRKMINRKTKEPNP